MEKKKVLIVTHSNDNPCIDTVSEALKKRGAEAVRFNSDLYPVQLRMSCAYVNNAWDMHFETPDGQRHNITEMEAVWYRRLRLGNGLGEQLDEKFLQPSIEETRRTFFGMMASHGNFQMDQITRLRYNEIKQQQLRVAAELGILVPKTLFTNDPDQVRPFLKECGERGMITKMQASFAIYEQGKENVVFTNVVTEDDLDGIENLTLCPMTFQEKLPKQRELRVTIVGDKIFTAEIDSQKSELATNDWRRDGYRMINDWQPHDLPKDLEAKLLKLMDFYGMNYGAIDLILTDDNEYYFLEVNPAGEFFWVDRLMDYKISEAMADVLLGLSFRRE